MEKITIYLPKPYANWIEDFCKNNQFSLSDAVRNLIKQHIDRFLKPSGLMVPDPYTNENVPFDIKFLNRVIQHVEDKKERKNWHFEKLCSRER